MAREGGASGPRDPEWRARVAEIFDAAPFVAHLGIRPTRITPGEIEAVLPLRPEHLQQDGVVHAGVQATLADHTAGAAAASLAAPGTRVLSIEFKINLLRAASGETLRCRAVVLRPGRTITVVESEVFAEDRGESRLVAKASVSLAHVVRPAATS